MSCSSDSLTQAVTAAASASSCPRLRHILTGSFNTVFLHLLTFDSLTRSLSVTLSVPAQGPHQYLALGRHGTSPDGLSGSASQFERVVYATTWAENHRVSAWRVGVQLGRESIAHINSQPITAAGSYLAVQPPPYNSNTSPAYGVPSRSRRRAKSDDDASSSSTGDLNSYLYQAGGPTGEVWRVDPVTGALEEQVQELIFLRGGREELLAGADTSRKSLRYGAHNVDFDVNGLGYIADLGRNAILVYARDEATGELSLVSEAPAPAEGDGPRHVVPSPDGHWVFAVTEHTSYIDAYRVLLASSDAGANRDNGGRKVTLSHKQRLSLLPDGAKSHDFRGDTIRLSPSGDHVFATTRGKNESIRGWVKAWRLRSAEDKEGLDVEGPMVAADHHSYQTPTSGGKANAWEWAPRYPLYESASEAQSASVDAQDWAVLTDDVEGYVLVMQWDGEEIREVARTRLPGSQHGPAAVEFIPHNGVTGEHEGASHAIWLD